ncbi:hypothetical protein K440DRAFT_624418 [Wilcoxina mikolae CBS 423.85]|nr:hypothetical protein K440DRAFT_624418 [Wilcoxina mikolae CBS 423.85]
MGDLSAGGFGFVHHRLLIGVGLHGYLWRLVSKEERRTEMDRQCSFGAFDVASV